MLKIDRVLTIRPGKPGYEPVMLQIRGNHRLLSAMWFEAETELAESALKIWVVAVDEDGGPGAWCAMQPSSRLTAPGGRVGWKLTDHYERRTVRDSSGVP